MAVFLDYVNNVLGKLRQTPITTLSTDNTTVAFRTQLAVQRAIARVWNAKQWSFKQSKVQFALAIGQSEYPLPRIVGEPYIALSSRPPYLLKPKSEDFFDNLVPNPIATGNPEFYMLWENAGVESQPTSASIISFSSNNAGDTTQKIMIRGLVGGVEDHEVISLNGTVTVNSTKQYSSIYSISKSDYTSGLVTVTSNSGAVSVLLFGPLEKTVRIKMVRFYSTPSSTLTVTMKHFKQPFVPTQDFDDAGIPSRWDYVVEQYAFAMSLQPLGQDQIAEQQAEFAIADKMVEIDMAAEETLSSAIVIVPNRALTDFPAGQGYIRSNVDGLSFEQDY